MQDALFIHQLDVMTLIGVLPHERVRPQKLILDIELTTDFTTAAYSDDLTDAVSYADIADHIVSFSSTSHCQLLEYFGQHLINSLFTHFPISRITLTITKPGAVVHTRDIGIRMQRIRPDDSVEKD